MRAVMTVIATLGFLGMVTANGPAHADEDDYGGGWRRHEWQEHRWREQRWREHEWRERAWHTYQPSAAYMPPSYYVPPPTYYVAPPPAYYAPPPPPVYAAPGISIGFGFR